MAKVYSQGPRLRGDDKEKQMKKENEELFYLRLPDGMYRAEGSFTFKQEHALKFTKAQCNRMIRALAKKGYTVTPEPIIDPTTPLDTLRTRGSGAGDGRR